MNIENERKLFEEFLAFNGESTHRWSHNGNYSSNDSSLAWKAWQASANREGFVLVANNQKTIVAIEQMVEQQVEASGITNDIFRLDGEKIMQAIIDSQENKDD